MLKTIIKLIARLIARIKGWFWRQKTIRSHDTMSNKSHYGHQKRRYGVKMMVVREGREKRMKGPGLEEIQAVGSWGTPRAAAKAARRLFIPKVRMAVPFEFER